MNIPPFILKALFGSICVFLAVVSALELHSRSERSKRVALAKVEAAEAAQAARVKASMDKLDAYHEEKRMEYQRAVDEIQRKATARKLELEAQQRQADWLEESKREWEAVILEKQRQDARSR